MFINSRTVVVAIAMMCGRFGALSGNLLFPVFVQIGCLPPFIMVSSVLICELELLPTKTLYLNLFIFKFQWPACFQYLCPILQRRRFLRL